VHSGAHRRRGVNGSPLGSDLVAKRQGGAGHGDAVQMVTGEHAGVRIPLGPIV
jgi:hypothetical protein